MDIHKYKPAVAKGVLLFLAGGLWFAVGLMLLFMAITWLREIADGSWYVYAGAGGLLAMFFHHFVFLRIVDKNLARLLPEAEKRCLFSFMPWKSYLMIPVMIAMGVVLRHSSFPKPYLSVIYMGIGLALVLSSVRYLRYFLKEIANRCVREKKE